MESTVTYYDGMDADPADQNNLQQFAFISSQHICSDAIAFDQQRYAGFNVTQTSTTAIAVGVGRLWDTAGIRWASNLIVPNDFVTNLPPGGAETIAILVGWGTTSADVVVPREFLIDEATGAAEPRNVSMETDWLANLSWIIGSPSANPVAPVASGAQCLICTVTLSTTGVASIVMNKNTALPNLQVLQTAFNVLQTTENAIEAQVLTLTSDIAQESNAIATLQNYTTTQIANILAQMQYMQNEIKALQQTSPVVIDIDYFLDITHSDTGNGSYSCRIAEGLRFPYGTTVSGAWTLNNPLDPLVTMAGTVMLPAFTPQVVVDDFPFINVGVAIALSDYTYGVTAWTQFGRSHHRIRFGLSFQPQTWSANYYYNGGYDPINNIFKLGSETFYDVANTQRGYPLWTPDRPSNYWDDSWNESYWNQTITTGSYTGSPISRTFLCGNNYTISHIGLVFADLAVSGSVTVAICECDSGGLPLFGNILSQGVLSVDNLILAEDLRNPANYETLFPISPLYLESGTRYAVIITSPGNHSLAGFPFSDGSADVGTCYGMIGSSWVVQQNCFSFRLHACQFANNDSYIQLNAIALAGGINALDVLGSHTIPDSCNLTYQYEVSGAWFNIDPVQAKTLAAVLGANLPMRIVCSGTAWAQPCIDFSETTWVASCEALSFEHISSEIDYTSTTDVHVIVHFSGFNGTYHTVAVTLLTGSSFGTTNTPGSTSTTDTSDGGWDTTYVFTVSASTKGKVVIAGTTSLASELFVIAQRTLITF